MSIEYNVQQKEIITSSVPWFRRGIKQVLEISGPAGSGKTTIARAIMEILGLKMDEVLFMAYVGKAAMALARNGLNAKTIHSSIYELVMVPKLDEYGNAIKVSGRTAMIPKFVKKEELDSRIKLLFIDEGSMVNEQMALDILSFGLPVIVMGDLNQLPPVFGNPYFLRNPDYILTMIMRQAEGNPIIHLSQKSIKGEYIKPGKYGDKCFVIEKEYITDNLMKSADAIICGRNKTRENINNYFRQNIIKTRKDFPSIGEKVICRKNNWDECIEDNLYLINGMIGYIKDINLETFNGKKLEIDFQPDFVDNDYFRRLIIDFPYLFETVGEKKERGRTFDNLFEFAYAITCHLSQGSQFSNVLYYDEIMGNKEFYNKLRYTAITRAREGLVMAI